MSLRCQCSRFLTKAGTCGKCELEYTQRGEFYTDNNGERYVVVNNKMTQSKEEKKMSFFKVNHDEAGGFDALPVGKYEAVVTEIEVKTSGSGNPMIKCVLTIRDDVDQKGKKRKVFDNIVQTENMMWKFQQVAKAVGIPNGADIATLQDFAKHLQFKAVQITLGQREYNGNMQNDVKGWNEPTTAYNGQGGANSDPFQAGNNEPIEISDEDLPF